jgi:choline/glycine/proline betaine transport protein
MSIMMHRVVECILGCCDWFIDLAMLMANGITALQNATIIMGLPFSFVMFLVMAGFYKSLRLRRSASQCSLNAAPVVEMSIF